jgi:hypothetical protein
MVLLVWPPAEHLWISRNRGPIGAFSAKPLDGQRRRRTLAEDPDSTRPELHFPAAQLKREQSLVASFGPADASYYDISNT